MVNNWNFNQKIKTPEKYHFTTENIIGIRESF